MGFNREDHDANQVLISFVRRRAKTSERQRFETPERGLHFCGDVNEDHRVSHSAQYLQSISGLVS